MEQRTRQTYEELSKQSIEVIKQDVAKDAWIALRQYFSKAGNGTEAKVACVVISNLAREFQSRNNARQLDMIERRFHLEGPARLKRIPAGTPAQQKDI